MWCRIDTQHYIYCTTSSIALQPIMIRLAVLLSLFIPYAVPLILTPADPVQLIENAPVRRQEGMSRTIRPNWPL